MTEERKKYLLHCSKREIATRRIIADSRQEMRMMKKIMEENKLPSEADKLYLPIPDEYCKRFIKIAKIKILACTKLLPDIKVRRSDGVLIVEDVIWKKFFKKYFDKCKNEDEILEMNVEICNAVKAAAKARMDKLYKKACS